MFSVLGPLFHASCVLARACLVFVFVFSSAQTAVRRSHERPENILDIKVSLVLRQRIRFLGWVSRNRALTVSPPSPPPSPLRSFFLDWGYLQFTWKNLKFRLENQMVLAIPFGKLRESRTVIWGGAIVLLFLVGWADLCSTLWRVVFSPRQILELSVYVQDFHPGSLCTCLLYSLVLIHLPLFN